MIKKVQLNVSSNSKVMFSFVKFFSFLGLFFVSQIILGQTISPSNGAGKKFSWSTLEGVYDGPASKPCGMCTHDGWYRIGGSPDIGNQISAAGPGTGGGGSKWVSAPGSTTTITLPIPPNGHLDYICARDTGNPLSEESVQSSMQGLVPGDSYELIIYALTGTTDSSGQGSLTYGKTYGSVFNYEVKEDVNGSAGAIVVPKTPIVLTSDSHNKWIVTRVRFEAQRTSERVILYPGSDCNTPSNWDNFEPVMFSVSLNALNRVPQARPDVATAVCKDKVVFTEITANDIDNDIPVLGVGDIDKNTVDLDPLTPGRQGTFTSANGVWTLGGVNVDDVVFTPNPGFIGVEVIKYTVKDNYILDNVLSPAISNEATLTATISTTPIDTYTFADISICTGSSGTLTLSGSQTGMLYQLKNGSTNVGAVVVGTSNPITFTVNPIVNTTYTVVATNRATTITGLTTACVATITDTATVTVQVNSFNPVVTTITQPTCTKATGTFQIPNYNTADTYTFTPAVANTSISATGLVTVGTGTYTFTHTPSGGCVSQSSNNVVINTQPLAAVSGPIVGTITQPTCAIATGTFQIPSYNTADTYTVMPAVDVIGISSTGLVTVKQNRIYNFTHTPVGGCMSPSSGNILINAQPTVATQPTAAIVTQPTCTVATGTFQINSYVAADTYTFTPTIVVANVSATGLVTAASGTTYTFTHTPVGGCESPVSANVVVNTQPIAATSLPTAGAVTQPTCTAASGTFQINNYVVTDTYTFTPSIASTSINTTGLVTAAAGIYTFTHTPVGGCESPASANVVVNAQPTVLTSVPTAAIVTQPTCTAATATFQINNYVAADTYTITPAIDVIGVSSTGLVTVKENKTYSFTHTPAGGCVSPSSGNILINAQPTVATQPTAAIVTQPTCTTATGTFQINSYVAADTYTFTPTIVVANVSATGLVTAVAGTTYTFTHTPVGGCKSPASANVVVNAQPTAAASGPTVGTVTQPTCATATGTFQINNYVAADTYTFTPSVASTSINTTGLVTVGAGTYTFTHTPVGGCVSPASANVVVNLQPTAATSGPTVGIVTQPTCAIATATFEILNYVSTDTYTITPAVDVIGISSTGLVTVKENKTYSFTHTPAGGCVSPSSGNILINAQPTVATQPTAAIVTQPTCTTATGTFQINSYVAADTYTFTPTIVVANVSATGLVTAVAGTTYTFTHTPVGGCESPASANVVVNAQPTAAASGPTVGTVTQPTCATATGTFQINNYVAADTYTFIPSVASTSINTTGLVTVGAGTYTFIHTPVGGCVSPASANVVVNLQPTAATSGPTVGIVTQPTCAIATATFEILNYVPADTYTITPAIDVIGISSTGLVTVKENKTYSFTHTPVGGCVSPASANVVVNAQPTAATSGPTAAIVTQPTCATATGTFQINSYVVTDTYTFTPTIVVTNVSATGLVTAVAGTTYTFTHTPVGGCESPASTNVVVNAQPTAAASGPTVGTVTQPTCATATGAFQINNYVVTDIYTFTPAVTSTSINTTGLVTVGAGTYTFTHTPVGGCESPASTNIVVNVQPTAATSGPTAGTVTQPTCTTATGTFQINNYVAADTYTFTPPLASTSINVTGLVTAAAGTYVFTHTPVGGCVSPASANVVVKSQPVPATFGPTVGAVTQPTCATATGTFQINNYVAADTYTFTPPVASTSISTAGLVTVGAGTYIFTHTPAQGCESPVSANVVVNVQPTAAVSGPPVGTITQPTCATPTGTFQIQSYNAADIYTVTPAIDVIGISSTGLVTVNDNKTYNFTHTPVGGCISPASANVVVNAQPTAAVSGPIAGTVAQPTCLLATATFQILNYVPLDTYTITPAVDVIGVSSTGLVTVAAGTTYTFTHTPVGGCVSPVSANILVNAQPAAAVSGPTAGTVTQPTCTAVTGTFQILNYVAADTYTFTPPVVSTSATGLVIASAGTTYTFTHTPVQGCESPASASVVVNAKPDCILLQDDINNTFVDVPVAGDVSTNDNIPTGSTVNVKTQPSPSEGTVVMSNDGTYVFTPTLGFTGDAVFTYEVCDTVGNCEVATVTVTVKPLPEFGKNTPPVATNDTGTTEKDVPVEGNLISNDYDPDLGDTIKVTVPAGPITTPIGGTVTINPNGTYKYDPPIGFTGEDIFTYEVCDDATPTPACDTATVTITVLPDNGNATYANDDVAKTDVNQIVNIDVLANDTDPESDIHRVTAVGIPTNGTVTLKPDGTIDYMPIAGFTGTDSFTYIKCDTPTAPNTSPVCDEATVIVTVYPEVPKLKDDINDTFVNVPVAGDVSTNDDIPTGSTVIVNNQPDPSEGTVVMSNDGTYVFTPTPGFIGDAVFTYEVCGNGIPKVCEEATVTVTVKPLPELGKNTPPVATNDTGITEIDVPVEGSLISNDYDPDLGDTIKVTVPVGPITTPKGGTVTINADGTYKYVPPTGFTGEDTFAYEVCDDATPKACDTATVTITVLPDNGNDTYANDDVSKTDEGQTVNIDVLENDTDPEADTFTVSSVGTPTEGGTAVLDPTTGEIKYTPASGFTGTDSFTYIKCDTPTAPNTSQVCDEATVIVTVYPEVVEPNTTLATNDINDTFVDKPVKGNVLTNDEDAEGNTQTVTAFDGPTNNGDLKINTDGTYTYTPAPGFVGEDTFTYEVCDNGTPKVCDEATVTVTVKPLLEVGENTPPVATNDTGTTEKDVPVEGSLLSNDYDPDLGDIIKVTVPTGPITTPEGGTVTINADGTYKYVPATGFTGEDTFAYEVCDDATPKACDTATVTITVLPDNGNDTFANDDVSKTDAGQTVSIDVLENDTDPESDTFTVSSVATPTEGGTAVLDPTTGEIKYTPASGFTGTDSFTYIKCDTPTAPNTTQVCDEATVIVTVYPEVVEPNTTLATNDINDTFVDKPVKGNVLTNDEDAEGNTQTVTAFDGPTNNGDLKINTDGTYTYTPAPGFVGEDTFTYEVCDNGTPKVCDEATVTVTVKPLLELGENTPPVATNDTGTTEKDVPVEGSLLSNDYDPDLGDIIKVTVPTGPIITPEGGTVTINADGTYKYVPPTGFTGEDTFTYEVCDDATPKACDTATVAITVLPDNGNDTYANDDVSKTNIGQTVNIDVLENDTDPEADTFTVSSVGTPTEGGTALLDPTTGEIKYTPATGFTGTDSFTYIKCDTPTAPNTTPVCDEATVIVTVYPEVVELNTTLATNDINDTFVDNPVKGNVLTNDEDAEGNTQTVTAFDGPTNNGDLKINTDGSYTYTPAPGFVGEDTFTYEVCDNGTPKVCDEATVTITVKPLLELGENTPPVATNDTGTTEKDMDVKGILISNDYDPDGDVINVTTPAVNKPTTEGGKVTIKEYGTYIYTPAPGFIGEDTFTYTICDDGSPSKCDTATVTITVLPDNGKNDTYANDDTYNTPLNTIVSSSVVVNDTDSEGDNHIKVTLGTNVSNGTLKLNLDGTFDYTPVDGYSGTDSFTYTVCDDGAVEACDVATVIITINPDPIENNGDNKEIIIYNEFSPNGDDINDFLKIEGLEKFPKNTISIFNRWGNTVYTGEGYDNNNIKFDGKSSGRSTINADKKLPVGTYYYILDLGVEGKEIIKGWIYIQK